MDDIFDLIIIGLGTGGLRAAKSACLRGLSVLAFEKGEIGGCCLNKGCIPTKSILHSSEKYKEISDFLNSKNLPLNPPDLKLYLEEKNKIVKLFKNAAEKDLTGCGVKILKENALIDFENLTVNDYKARNIICATGSMPYELSNLPFDGVNILSSDNLINLEKLPKSITIIGSGAIGIEWARIFSNFNVKVNIVEKALQLLPLMDLSIQKRISRILKLKKIETHTGCSAVSFKNGFLELDNGKVIETEKILVAAGRKKVFQNGLKINPDLSTNFKNVYAIGDIASKKMLAHTANMHADYIIDKITGQNPYFAPDIQIPSVIYGNPEIASIGINEQDIENKDDYKIKELPLSFLPKAWCDNKTDGFIKIITKNNKIEGAHIISPEASSLIGQISIAMKTGANISDIKNIVFAHPTYSEGIYETILHR